eukprot:c1771_g1_i1.p1 GENE.c1771_g1_i1~~c1771_g1_i1.p1  ORF type:complete len:120 (-),score=8.55 c1771_g1_i1:157-516(-)
MKLYLLRSCWIFAKSVKKNGPNNFQLGFSLSQLCPWFIEVAILGTMLKALPDGCQSSSTNIFANSFDSMGTCLGICRVIDTPVQVMRNFLHFSRTLTRQVQKFAFLLSTQQKTRPRSAH